MTRELPARDGRGARVRRLLPGGWSAQWLVEVRHHVVAPSGLRPIERVVGDLQQRIESDGITLGRNGMILSRGWAKRLAGALAREVEVALPSP